MAPCYLRLMSSMPDAAESGADSVAWLSVCATIVDTDDDEENSSLATPSVVAEEKFEMRYMLDSERALEVPEEIPDSEVTPPPPPP